ncbi:methanethiol S-methyltransferase [Pseudomonas yamanorum]
MNSGTPSNGMAARLAMLFYSAVSYGIFLISVVYLIGFLGRLLVPKHIDDGITLDWLLAALANIGLISLFAVQHSVMARKGFKARLTRVIPATIERSTYVLISSLILGLMFWLWQPITASVWTVDSPLARALITGLFWTGWAVVFVATLLISHFDLFGLRQAIDHLRGTAPRAQPFKTPALYKVVRHPLYLGFLIAFWATPDMTAGHLLFALAFTAYIFIGAHIEEKDLVALFGETYRRYQKEVGMVLPWRRKG